MPQSEPCAVGRPASHVPGAPGRLVVLRSLAHPGPRFAHTASSTWNTCPSCPAPAYPHNETRFQLCIIYLPSGAGAPFVSDCCPRGTHCGSAFDWTFCSTGWELDRVQLPFLGPSQEGGPQRVAGVTELTIRSDWPVRAGKWWDQEKGLWTLTMGEGSDCNSPRRFGFPLPICFSVSQMFPAGPSTL